MGFATEPQSHREQRELVRRENLFTFLLCGSVALWLFLLFQKVLFRIRWARAR
jgi:hypothetical protein